MADFAGTVTLESDVVPPFAGHPGGFAFQIALAAATYGAGDLNLTAIAHRLNGIEPKDVKAMTFTVEAAAGYMVNFAPAASPTWANMGALALRTATGTAATGTLTFTLHGFAFAVRNKQ